MAFLILDMSANVQLGSPGLLGIKTFLYSGPPISSAILLTEIVCPLPTLNISFEI